MPPEVDLNPVLLEQSRTNRCGEWQTMALTARCLWKADAQVLLLSGPQNSAAAAGEIYGDVAAR
jgi:hypothetical protein